ncbi:MAG: hypothetical protein LHV68_03075 [Elusimicrobia bacterium]|nr:hypothetical protein [Candidatus Liberimonas magnetica]
MMILAVPILVVTAIGYWVLITAYKEQHKGLKTLGSIIGYVIIVVTTIALVFCLLSPICCPGMMGGHHMGMMKHGKWGKKCFKMPCGPGMLENKGMTGGKCGMMQKEESEPEPENEK